MRTILNILSKWGPSATNTTKMRTKNVFKPNNNITNIHKGYETRNIVYSVHIHIFLNNKANRKQRLKTIIDVLSTYTNQTQSNEHCLIWNTWLSFKASIILEFRANINWPSTTILVFVNTGATLHQLCSLHVQLLNWCLKHLWLSMCILHQRENCTSDHKLSMDTAIKNWKFNIWIQGN